METVQKIRSKVLKECGKIQIFGSDRNNQNYIHEIIK
jgi:hypothetical protein